jgi:hypothetical protein
MKVVAAYLLAVLGGNTCPTAEDLKNILGSGTFFLPSSHYVFIFLFSDSCILINLFCFFFSDLQLALMLTMTGSSCCCPV